MKRRIRIAASLSNYSAPSDAITNADVKLWRGGAVDFELAFFRAGRPGEETLAGAADITDLESLSLTLKPMSGNAAPGADVEATVAASTDEFAELVYADWQAGTAAHATLALSTAQMALAAGSYWLTIWALTPGGEKVVVVAGKVTVLEASVSEPGEPPPAGTTWITVSEADARYFRVSPDGTVAPDQLPDEMDVRLEVLGGTPAQLAAVVLGRDELAVVRDVDGVPTGIRIGDGTTAGGKSLSGMGEGNIVGGDGAMAFGNDNTAGAGAFVVGAINNAAGDGSSAFGIYNATTNFLAGAFGYGNTASGYKSMALGTVNTASAEYAVAIGHRVTAATQNVLEVGNWWIPSTSDPDRILRRCAIRMHDTGMLAMTVQDRATAYAPGDDLDQGAEADNEIATGMFAIRRNGLEFVLDYNDAGTVKSVSLGTVA